MTQAMTASQTRGKGRLADRIKAVVAWILATRIARAFARFTSQRGNLLSAGMSYQALFAIFAALWLGFAIAGVWLVSNPALLDSVIAAINRAVPGLIGTGGAVSRSALLNAGGTLGWTGIIAAIGLIMTTIGWLSSTRDAVRAMFQVGSSHRNAVLQKLSDLGLGLGFGVLLIVAAMLSLLTTAVLGTLYDLFGIGASSPWATAITQTSGFILTAIINMVVVAVMYRVLSELAIPWRGLLTGSAVAAVALTVMSGISGLLLGGATKNPLAASFGVILGLLIWFNLVCRVLLLCASWIALGMADRDEPAEDLSPEQLVEQRHTRELRARIVLAEGALADRQADARVAQWPRRRASARRARTAARELAMLRGELAAQQR